MFNTLEPGCLAGIRSGCTARGGNWMRDRAECKYGERLPRPGTRAETAPADERQEERPSASVWPMMTASCARASQAGERRHWSASTNPLRKRTIRHERERDIRGHRAIRSGRRAFEQGRQVSVGTAGAPGRNGQLRRLRRPTTGRIRQRRRSWLAPGHHRGGRQSHVEPATCVDELAWASRWMSRSRTGAEWRLIHHASGER